jgi:hypothetical protein
MKKLSPENMDALGVNTEAVEEFERGVSVWEAEKRVLELEKMLQAARLFLRVRKALRKHRTSRRPLSAREEDLLDQYYAGIPWQQLSVSELVQHEERQRLKVLPGPQIAPPRLLAPPPKPKAARPRRKKRK